MQITDTIPKQRVVPKVAQLIDRPAGCDFGSGIEQAGHNTEQLRSPRSAWSHIRLLHHGRDVLECPARPYRIQAGLDQLARPRRAVHDAVAAEVELERENRPEVRGL